MELILETDNPTSTALLNPDGNPVYSIKSPFKLTHWTSTIYKNVLDDNGNLTGAQEELARIQWHNINSTRLIFKGELLEVNKFMPTSDRWGM